MATGVIGLYPFGSFSKSENRDSLKGISIIQKKN